MMPASTSERNAFCSLGPALEAFQPIILRAVCCKPMIRHSESCSSPLQFPLSNQFTRAVGGVFPHNLSFKSALPHLIAISTTFVTYSSPLSVPARGESCK